MKAIVAVAAAAMFALSAAQVGAENAVQFHGRLPVSFTSPCNGENVTGTIATSLLITVIGVAASADVLRRKPLATLRAE